jgi:HEAT repeat protein
MLNPKFLLKLLPIVFLSIGSMIGTIQVGRSEVLVAQSQDRQSKEITLLIQQLKSSNENEQRSAIYALVELGEPAIAYIVPLFKDPNPIIRGIAAETLDRLKLKQIPPSPNMWDLGAPLEPPNNLGLEARSQTKLPNISVDEAIKALRAAINERRASNVFTIDAAEGQLVRIGQPAVQKLIALLQDDDVEIRSTATEVLRKMQSANPQFIASLTALLRNPDANIRSNAAQVLARWGKVTKPTLITLLKDPNPKVRSGAAEAFGRMSGTPKSAIPSLIPLLKDENPSVRAYTLWALMNMRGFAKPAIPALTTLLKDEDDQVRLLASQVLDYLKSPNGLFVEPSRPIAPLLPALFNPNSGPFPSPKPTPKKPVTPAYLATQTVQALRDAEDYDDKDAAIAQLAEIGKPAVEKLIPLLNDEYPEIRARAATGLSAIGEAAIPALLPLLKHENANFRGMAAAALGNMKKSLRTNVPALIPLLQDPDANVQSQAKHALESLISNNPDVLFQAKQALESNAEANPDQSKSSGNRAWEVAFFVPLLRDQNAEVRAISAYAISYIGKPAKSAVPALIPLLRDADIQVRSHTLKALRSIGKPAEMAIPFIIPLLREQDPETQHNDPFDSLPSDLSKPHIRAEAASALAAMGDLARPALPDLLPLLKDRSSIAKRHALEAIGNMGQSAQSAIPDIIPLLKEDSMLEVQSSAARILGNFGEPAKAAIPALVSLLHNQWSSVRSSAAEALGKMGESARPTIPSLIPLLKDADPDVRSSAAAALEKLGYKP